MRFEATKLSTAGCSAVLLELCDQQIARGCLSLSLEGGKTAFLDENHATALALALQAAVAEIQARAVSR